MAFKISKTLSPVVNETVVFFRICPSSGTNSFWFPLTPHVIQTVAQEISIVQVAGSPEEDSPHSL